MKTIKAADILLPDVGDMSRWSVIACDQFTSDRGYWDETRKTVGDAPSTLNMILPEALIGTPDAERARERVSGYMKSYLDSGLFRKLPGAFMYIEREFEDGTVRHGIVAAVDLEEYEYKPEKEAAIKATERTVEERLYKRIELKENAVLELPHVLIFYRDPSDHIVGQLRAWKPELNKEYEFELMQDGGHIKGWSVSGEKAAETERELNGLVSAEGTGALAMGDGNHSLATAKLFWERIKSGLTDTEAETHPARYALAELVNIYDSGIRIEPIHRVISGSDVSDFTAFAGEHFAAFRRNGGEHLLRTGSAADECTIGISGLTVGQIVEETDRMIAEYLKEHGGAVDYIHDDETAVGMGRHPGCAFVLLPAVEKEEIFDTVKRKELFPKKCFSIGSAREKRYYLECRKIR